MSNRILFIVQALLATALLSFHLFAFQHDLYWHYVWLDIPMHFLGGVWAALVSTWLLRFAYLSTPVAGVVLGVIAIAIGWEVMEYAIGFQRESNYAFDTALDLVMDALGGACGFLIARRMVQSAINGTSENNPS